MGVESYKHQFAKATLAGWFREIADGNVDVYVGINPVRWRVNRGSPHYGVWTEYPIAVDKDNRLHGNSPVWDESNWDGSEVYKDASGKEWSCAEYFSLLPPDTDGPCSLFQKPDSLLNVRPPTYDELLNLKLLPLVIFDIAIQHKGIICDAFEVVHKNGISEIKAEYLNRVCRHGPNVYTIDADWILSRVKRPDQLICKRVI